MIQVHILFWIIRDGKKFGEVSFENLIFGVHFNFVVEVMFDFFFLIHPPGRWQSSVDL